MQPNEPTSSEAPGTSRDAAGDPGSADRAPAGDSHPGTRVVGSTDKVLGRPVSSEAQVSSERRLEEGCGELAADAQTEHLTSLQRLAAMARDPDALAYVCYTAGLATDAYGRAHVSRKALLAGAAVISGIDAAQALGPLVEQLRARWAKRPAEFGELLHSVLNSSRFGFQIGVSGQTISAISQQGSDLRYVELNRAEAQKAGGFGAAAAVSSFGAFVMSVVKRMPETGGGDLTATLADLRVAVLKALKDPEARNQLVDSIALSIEAAGRRRLNPLLITIGSALQLGNYGLSVASKEYHAEGSVAKRGFVAAASMAMFGAFAGTTAKTWSSVEPTDPSSSTVQAKRADLSHAYVCSVIAAASAASLLLVTAANRWRSDTTTPQAEAARLRRVPESVVINPAAQAARLHTPQADRPAPPTRASHTPTAPRPATVPRRSTDPGRGRSAA